MHIYYAWKFEYLAIKLKVLHDSMYGYAHDYYYYAIYLA
jgi:hypothetical protein